MCVCVCVTNVTHKIDCNKQPYIKRILLPVYFMLKIVQCGFEHGKKWSYLRRLHSTYIVDFVHAQTQKETITEYILHYRKQCDGRIKRLN